MDGVPQVTQCPIPPHTTFRYKFTADSEGTHWWHSHAGIQRSDGAFGALIVRQPKSKTPNVNLYEFDLSEHTIFIQDWIHITAMNNFNSFHHSIGDNKPTNILINGKGKFINAEELPVEIRTMTTEPNGDEPATTILTETTIVPLRQNEVDAEHIGRRYVNQTKKSTAILPIPITDKPVNQTVLTTETEQPTTVTTDKKFVVMNALHKQKRAADEIVTTPLEIYEVMHGRTYRFRMINAGFLNCPVEVSIDHHNLTVIATDGWYFEPITVATIVVYAGERFDFVVNASQSVGNYWIRVRGLMDCDERFTKAHQVAILRYAGAMVEEPAGDTPIYEHERHGIQLNALNKGTGHNDSISIAELTAIDADEEKILQPIADYKFYVYYDFYDRDNPHYNNPDLYGIDASKRFAIDLSVFDFRS